MIELSDANKLVWAVAANEVIEQVHQEFIEPEHLFIALCRARDVFDEQAMQDLREHGVDPSQVKAELELIPSLLQGLGHDPKGLRRELRGFVGKGAFVHKPDQPVHRSARSRIAHDRAATLADSSKCAASHVGHLTLAILEAADTPLRQFLGQRGIDVDVLVSSVRRALEEKSAVPACSPPKAHQQPPAPPQDPKGPPCLSRFGYDLTRLAREGKLKTVIGRREEMRQLARTLNRSDKNNPLLVGEPPQRDLLRERACACAPTGCFAADRGARRSVARRQGGGG